MKTVSSSPRRNLNQGEFEIVTPEPMPPDKCRLVYTAQMEGVVQARIQAWAWGEGGTPPPFTVQQKVKIRKKINNTCDARPASWPHTPS